MRRLVYSPKAFVFVRTQDHPEGLDISDFVTAGNVNRVVNEVSTAEITLRNPVTSEGAHASNKFGRFTLNLDDPTSTPEFHPMDPITIFLARYTDKPVQVFTGYLDTTPYVQLFPGTITLKASCTLKRLLYTFWDPALPFTREYLGQFGWVSDVQSGQLVNWQALESQLTKDAPQLRDSGFGDLLYHILQDIGGWADSEIYIEKLPNGIIKSVERIFNEVQKDNIEAEKAFTNLLSKMIGTGSAGTAGGQPTSTGSLQGMDKIVPVVKAIADTHHLPPLFVLTTGWEESKWKAIPEGGSGQGAQQGDFGYFQMRTDGKPPYGYASQQTVTKAQTSDVGFATNLFCIAAAFKAQQNPSYLQNWATWAKDVQVSVGYPDWDQGLALMKTQYNRFKDGPLPAGILDSTAMHDSGTTPNSGRQTPAKRGGSSGNSSTLFYPLPKQYPIVGAYGEQRPGHQHAGVDLGCPVHTPVFACKAGAARFGNDPKGYGWYITIDHGGGLFTRYAHLSELTAIWAKVLVNQSVTVKAGEQIAWSGGQPGAPGAGDASGPHLHFEVRNDSGFGFQGTMDPITFLNGAAFSSGGTFAGGNDSSTSTTDSGNVMANTTAAAFATQIEFPGAEETIESVLLNGQKSLMNDKPLMPFVQQLANSSLRSFQSLPNGSFFAFFPDYFGAYFHRQPYWEIDKIEILDGKIDLSDDSLATHVFVVGDTYPFAGGPSDIVNKLASGGVVTVFNAFNDHDWTINGNEVLGQDGAPPAHTVKSLADKGTALAFLKKFGARPLFQEEPFIRSPYFEAFMAFQLFQLLWSRQFLTTFSLTFMPELFPGGRVVFPDYGFAAYIDQVQHIWDYESGFTTRVDFSAPSNITGRGDAGENPITRGMVNAVS